MSTLNMTLAGNRFRRRGRVEVDGLADLPVLILAISEVGARFSVADPAQVPGAFTLVIEPQQIRMACQTLRRSGDEVGVRFD
ncbi:hypothetical protein [Methylobacterium oxalidis]|uniref:PilZ domain-containing protein n=1 Tax=Methylobacterium oxalidis TaxID=944322 RepID=A0A512IWB7_9HYPH|nr:hypothetical protein [Methylobacterium oxalidis]GEP02002.1 hypothetical protein MOX02_00400 [Methylobacterium oxalidis]GJE30173.1 hypothetical protein LDDCCGHA_0336 [Methylobacterium oxalidis]GLS61947.1 hypothetical protein GCM10007888_03280 [Methylobacterium oxalidis]